MVMVVMAVAVAIAMVMVIYFRAIITQFSTSQLQFSHNRNLQQTHSKSQVVKSGSINLSSGQGTKPAFRPWKIKGNHNIKNELAQKMYMLKTPRGVGVGVCTPKYFLRSVWLRFSIGYPSLRKFWLKAYPWLRRLS